MPATRTTRQYSFFIDSLSVGKMSIGKTYTEEYSRLFGCSYPFRHYGSLLLVDTSAGLLIHNELDYRGNSPSETG